MNIKFICVRVYIFIRAFRYTIIPLREGLVLYNASRVNHDNEPKLFKSWDKIWIDKCYGANDIEQIYLGGSVSG